MSLGKLGLGICGLFGLLTGVDQVWADEAAVSDSAAQGNPAVQRIFPQTWPISVRGWVDGGYTFNGSSPTSHFNGPYNQVDRDRPQLNQLYLVVEKALKATSGIDAGFRVDAMYGHDYFLAQSNGIERNQSGTPKWNREEHGIALPQMYAEVGNQTFSVKAGHFYTIIGYEGVPAPANFFYSKSYSYQFAGPFTHWGGLATWNLTPQLTLQGGVVNGWDAFDRRSDKPAYVLKAKYTMENNFLTASFGVITGEEPTAVPEKTEQRTRYSAIIGVNPTDDLEYVFHHHYAYQEDGKLGGGTARWYGVDQYLYYRLHQKVKAGLRFEWMRDEAGTRVGGSPDRGNPNLAPFAGSFYSLTGGVNYYPHSNVTIRPEVRYDWFIGGRNPYNDGQKDNQVLVAINAYLQF